MLIEHPEVTVIIPSRDSGQYIGKCIESVIMQSFTDWELLIINDGSSDDTCDIVRSYADRDPRISLVDSDGSGVSAARNRGLELARGRYIAFIDSDDRVALDYLSVLVDSIIREDADMSQCSFFYLYRDDKKVKDTESGSGVYEGKDDILDAFFYGNIGKINVACWGKLFKRDLIQDIRFDETLMIQEDAFFTFQCCMKAGKIVCSNKALYYYYQHPESTMGQSFDASNMHFFTVFDREIDECRHNESIVLSIMNRRLITALDLTSKILRDNSGSEYLEELRKIVIGSSDYVRKNGSLGFKTGLKVFLIKYCRSAYYGLIRNKNRWSSRT